MRKLMILLTAAVLLLCGCSEQQPMPSEPTLTEVTQPQAYYVQDSAVELQTQGTARYYALPENILWIQIAGEQILVGTEQGVQLLEQDKGTVVASSGLDASYPDHWTVLNDGFAFYDQDDQCMILLDEAFNQEAEIVLSEEMKTPVISPDGKLIYYCAEQEIRVYEVEHKISRLLKSHSCTSQKLTGTYFGGQMLSCDVVETVGNEKTVYISTANGETLSSDMNIQELYTCGDRYFVVRSDGIVVQQLVGKTDGEPKLLTAEDDYVTGALEIGSLLGYGIDDNDALVLNLYNADTGIRTATESLQGFGLPTEILASEDSGNIWLLTETADGECLLRWAPSNELQEETVHFGKLYTQSAPDKAGLEKLNERVSKLNSQYGVRIRIWQEAVKVTEGYNLKPEYQVPVIEQVLDELEAVFQEFPAKFLYNSISSRVRICIVRSVDAEASSVQFWSDKYAFVVLCPGEDIRSEFLKSFGFVVDSHVLGNSALFDYWNGLNPEGFAYGAAVDGTLAQGEDRAFVDVDSMSSATVDRSRIFWKAMEPDNADMFQSEIMQKKLQLLCKAIRDAWRLENKTDIYPWEQYLTEPIAAKK